MEQTVPVRGWAHTSLRLPDVCHPPGQHRHLRGLLKTGKTRQAGNPELLSVAFFTFTRNGNFQIGLRISLIETLSIEVEIGVVFICFPVNILRFFSAILPHIML